MTIKELENKTGMTRANIRFYEGEGLLSPKRLDNGYRDYSEEDARTLEKIRLLRQLQVDIDTIRKVQQGELTLEQALFSQLTKLEGDRAVIERAAQVCRELEQSGVEYGALDPQPYLLELETPARPVLPNPPPPAPKESPDNTPRACDHPWMRWLARTLDMALYGMVFDVLLLVVLRDQTIVLAKGAMSWLLQLLLLAFTLAVEPFWLHCWGWTPGKWVFGLKLRDEQGGKLTLSQGFCRSGAVAWAGYGLNIPLYSLWRFWKCRELGLEGRDCPWDGENGFRYTKEKRRFSGWIFAGAQVICIAALVLGIKYSQTPVNQGGLTVGQFAANYNYYFHQLADSGSTGLPTLDGNGCWTERRYSGGTGTVIIDELFGGTTVWDEPQFTLSGGQVLAVTLHMESEDSLVGGGDRGLLALLAMTGALDGVNLFNYDLKGWARMYEEQLSSWENADLDYRGLHISQQVEYEGYQVSNSILWGDGETYCHCEKTVTISLID